MDKTTAETNPKFKQLIPYILIQEVSHGTLCCYRRSKKSGETRLHSLRSLGIGGHIERQDVKGFSLLCDIAEQCALREVLEELGLQPSRTLQLLGLINDDSTEVGRVHLGLVYRLLTDASELLEDVKLGEEVEEFLQVGREWLETVQDLEPWSNILRGALLSGRCIPWVG